MAASAAAAAAGAVSRAAAVACYQELVFVNVVAGILVQQ
jgi:hypothetical protein